MKQHEKTQRNDYIKRLCEKVLTERNGKKATRKMIVVDFTEEAKKLNVKRLQ